MAERIEVRIPDLGGAQEVEVVDLLVQPGAQIAAEDGLITLSSEKATMDVPSPSAGKVVEIKVAKGQKVKEGDLIAVLEGVAASQAPSATSDKPHLSPSPSPEGEGRPAVVAATTDPSPSTEGPGERYDTDLLVLGSGPGGYTAAFRAADLGLKVTLVERYPTLGGVCLNVGCIPSKALLHVAKVIDDVRAVAAHGVVFGPPQIDLDKIRAWKTEVVGRRTKGLVGLAQQRKIEVVQGTGTLAGPHALDVVAPDGAKRTITFAQAILAAGSRVVEIPHIPYSDPRVLDSTRALELDKVPGRLLVIGGGIIGLEMATFFRALGSKVTVVEMMEGLIPGCDRDLVRPLQKKIETQYEAIHLKTKVAKIEPEAAGLRATYESEQPLEPQLYDAVLVAVGRRPNGDRIGAQAAGVHVSDRGFVPADKQMRTNVPHIFAIGDLAGNPMLAHKAEHEGKTAAEVAAGHKAAFDARVIPSVAYTDPEVAWVGLTETEAKAKSIAVEKVSFPWSASARADTLMSPEGTTKLLFDPSTRRLVGAGITGANAGDLIAELALAIEMGCEAADLALTVHPHPTLSETVMKAAEVQDGSITDLLPPRKRK